MRVFYDTEFIEDGHTIELISIGIVAEDGREYYAVNSDIYFDDGLCKRIRDHSWLMNNVVPHLPGHISKGVAFGDKDNFVLDINDTQVKPRWVIRNEVREFLLAIPDPALWAWYGAYDHVVLAQLFGRMIDLPNGVPMFTNDLKQETARLGDPRVPQQPDGMHNALADARHNLAIARFLDEYASSIERS